MYRVGVYRVLKKHQVNNTFNIAYSIYTIKGPVQEHTAWTAKRALWSEYFSVNVAAPYSEINKDASLDSSMCWSCFLTTLLNIGSSSAGISGPARARMCHYKAKTNRGKNTPEYHHYIFLPSLAVYESKTGFMCLFTYFKSRSWSYVALQQGDAQWPPTYPWGQASASITRDTKITLITRVVESNPIQHFKWKPYLKNVIATLVWQKIPLLCLHWMAQLWASNNEVWRKLFVVLIWFVLSEPRHAKVSVVYHSNYVCIMFNCKGYGNQVYWVNVFSM